MTAPRDPRVAFRVTATVTTLRGLADVIEARGLPANQPDAHALAVELHDRAVTLLNLVSGAGPTCKHCDKPLVRKRRKSGWETPAQLAERSYCDLNCRNAAASLLKAARQKTPSPQDTSRTCIQCSGPITKRKGESRAAYTQRRFCSRPCARRWNVLHLPPEARGGAVKGTEAAKRGAAAARAAKAAKTPTRKPAPPVRVREEVATRPRRRSEFDAFPVPSGYTPHRKPGEQHEPIRMTELGDPCPKHPTYKLNVWGQCAACVTGARWAARQRETTARPSAEGGR